MANEGSAFGAVLPRWRTGVTLADAGFVALLLLVFVGLSPFEVRDSAALLHGADQSGSGSVWRQICYLAVFALTAAIALAWLVRQPGIPAPIASARTVEQLHQMLEFTRLELSQDQLGRLTAAGS